MHAGKPLDDAERAPWLAAVHAIAAHALDRREHMVIACSALRRPYRAILRGDRHPVRFVYLQGTEAELRRRLTERPGHFAGPSLLQSQIAALEAPTADEALTVDATWTPERILGAIRIGIRRLTDFQPFRRTHRDDAIPLPQLDDTAEVFALRKFLRQQPVAQPPQLVAIQIADEFVHQLRRGPRRGPRAMLQELVENRGAVA